MSSEDGFPFLICGSDVDLRARLNIIHPCQKHVWTSWCSLLACGWSGQGCGDLKTCGLGDCLWPWGPARGVGGRMGSSGRVLELGEL